MKHLYYYVEPCPNCGSKVTGRYVKDPVFGRLDQKKNALFHGELIRFSAKNDTAFCMECGYEWKYRCKGMYITEEELKKEKEDREIEDFLKVFPNPDVSKKEKLVEKLFGFHVMH